MSLAAWTFEGMGPSAWRSPQRRQRRRKGVQDRGTSGSSMLGGQGSRDASLGSLALLFGRALPAWIFVWYARAAAWARQLLNGIAPPFLIELWCAALFQRSFLAE